MEPQVLFRGKRSAFPFVANPRPILRGTAGAVVFIAIAIAWAAWSGRVKIDSTWVLIVVASTVVSLPLSVGSTWRNARRAASILGRIEADDIGIRWIRGDASPGFELSWPDVERATVDTRNAMIVLYRIGAGPVVVGVLSQYGGPSGFVIIDHFKEVVELVKRRVPTALHVGTTDPSSGRRTIALGIITCVAAAAMYTANRFIAGSYHWTRLLVPMPAFVALVGLLTFVAGMRVRGGNGPLVSPMYGSAFPRIIIRFLVVASLANFVLLFLFNLRLSW